LVENPLGKDFAEMISIEKLGDKHLEDAANLVKTRFQQLYRQIPCLPDRYADVDTYVSLLNGILSAPGTGVAAIRGKQLVGFLTGWQMESFRGKRSIYSPEWANAADLSESARIYEEMYTHMASKWVADQYIAHYISLFSNDGYALNAWHWMGFGMISVDGLRNMDPVLTSGESLRIRPAEVQDIDRVMDLREALRQYMKEAPIFFQTDKEEQIFYEEWIRAPRNVAWLGVQNDEPVSLMMVGPADIDTCTIIQDEKTTSIYAAYTEEKSRGEGFGTALLNHALKSAKVSGYQRCSVSFEPMNLQAKRFWLKYFQPVCISVVRYIDERIV
jgi:ribosomal protein S18 acetylase RimI-like enzyme